MSNLLRDPVPAVLMLGGAAVNVTAIVVWIPTAAADDGRFGGDLWLLVLALAGLAVGLTGPALHDRGHRRRGEPPHAMWGAGDRNRPDRLPRRPGPRPPSG